MQKKNCQLCGQKTSWNPKKYKGSYYCAECFLKLNGSRTARIEYPQCYYCGAIIRTGLKVIDYHDYCDNCASKILGVEVKNGAIGQVEATESYWSGY